MEKCELKIGDVVQIDPNHDPVFGGCFMLVTDPKPWGAQGACLGPEYNGITKGIAYYRCIFKNMELVGHAAWMISHEEETASEDADRKVDGGRAELPDTGDGECSTTKG